MALFEKGETIPKRILSKRKTPPLSFLPAHMQEFLGPFLLSSTSVVTKSAILAQQGEKWGQNEGN